MNEKPHGNRLARCLSVLCLLVVLANMPVLAANSDYTLVEGDTQMPIPETYTLEKVINSFRIEEGVKVDGIDVDDIHDGDDAEVGQAAAADAEEETEEGGEEGGDTTGETSGQAADTLSNSLNNPNDLFINEQGYMFIADTGNNRIVKMTLDGVLLGVFTGPKDSPLKTPNGVFADDEGNMYVADTGNYRIVHLSADGSFVEEFTRPESPNLPEDFNFDPTKVIVSDTGYIYALKGQYLISIDGYGKFRGFVGQSKLPFSLSRWLARIFASKEQLEKMSTEVPDSYTNVTLSDDNMIYASSEDTTEGELKKLNSIGTNIYKKYGKSVPEWLKALYTLNFDDIPFSYGDRQMDMPRFVDISVDSDEIVTAIDAETCRLFQYDKDANLLAIFGSYDERDGGFIQPISLDVDADGTYYILDKSKNNIQAFKPTAFIKNVHAAVGEYNKGDYDKASELWSEVLKTGENYQLAHAGIAQAAYKQEDWQKSMEEYKLAGDRVNYSKAFAKYRHSLFRGNFILVVLGACALMAALGAMIFGLKKMSARAEQRFVNTEEGRYSTANLLKLSPGVFFHPIDTFRAVKECRGRLKVWAGLILVVLTLITRLLVIFATNYPLVTVNPRQANILIEVGKILLPLLTFVIACYAVTAIVGGESKLSEIFTASCFCMVPYIVVNIVMTALSYIMCRTEAGVYIFAVKAAWYIVFLLFIINICVLNNYGAGKTIFVGVVSVFVMILTWITILLVLSLSAQLVEFIAGIFREIRMSQL